MNNSIEKTLNKAQLSAVTAPLGNYLVLAGAGSGKTRVLASRVAWLIQEQHVSPHAIVAVTFTNKAAAEMRSRIESLIHMPAKHLWIGTFHGLAHRILRAHAPAAGLEKDFQILDSDDQYRLIRRTLKALELDEKQWSPRQAQWFINSQKDRGHRPHHIDTENDVYLTTMRQIYTAYEEACARGGLIDFAELLLRAHELWLQHPELLQHYQSRFSHILVDEFQDTNAIQYAWIRLLAGSQNHVIAVGDDDQSIYGWRGAQIENIHRFEKDFPETTLIRLEQNYRSTATILEAANHLIANNAERLGKKLWTEGEQGDKISVYAAFNEMDEAKFIVARVQDWFQSGRTLSEVALLYRSNAQSRVLEEALIQAGIAYRIYGGLRFFERAEIKDALAYLRLIASRQDDAAFERVINFPTRGIGDKTVQLLRELARREGTALWQAAQHAVSKSLLTTRAAQAVTTFLQLIDTLAVETETMTLGEQASHVLRGSGLWQHFENSKNEKTQARLENLQEFVLAAKQFVPDPDDNIPPLSAFLSHAALEAGDAQGESYQDCVQLMTLHSAKGLEFPLVFLAGVEEGLFPHKMSLDEGRGLAEERRLCYVGVTRAMEKLYITYAEMRRLYNTDEYHRPSRFIREIPRELLESVRLQRSTTSASYTERMDDEGEHLQLGQRVRHAKFGDGTIVNYEGQGEHARVQVQFTQYGTKWLVLAYANLAIV